MKPANPLLQSPSLSPKALDSFPPRLTTMALSAGTIILSVFLFLMGLGLTLRGYNTQGR